MGQILTRGDLRKLHNRLLKPISTRSFALAVLGVAIVLGLVTTLCIVALYQNQPSFNFMKTEELKILSVAFPSYNSAVISVKNTGTGILTITRVTINNTAVTPTYGFYIETDGTLPRGASGTITISNWTWTNGCRYVFELRTATGNRYPYTTTATLGGSTPSPEPGTGPSVDFSPLIVASLIDIIVIVVLAGVVVLDRKHYLRKVPAPALAVLAILMILGLLVALWLVVSYSYHP